MSFIAYFLYPVDSDNYEQLVNTHSVGSGSAKINILIYGTSNETDGTKVRQQIRTILTILGLKN